MPTVTIDTFFACSLLVSVAIIATAFMAGTMQTQINSMQNINKQDYLRTIADHIVSSYGAPVDWGSTNSIPVNFGLSDSKSAGSFELDIDKISRLSSQNEYSLSYPEISKAARLTNIAFGVSLTQMLSIDVEPSGNTTLDDVTEYTFTVSVRQESGPVAAGLRCYVLAGDFMGNVSGATSSSGVSNVSVEIPNSSSGPAILVVFARATFDDRMTAFEVYPFAHQSMDPLPNHTFSGLSSLNYSLATNPNFPSSTIENGYVFSYNYQSNLTSTSSNTYAIPKILDESPLVILVQGVNGTTQFAEWTSYPQLPLDVGADFRNSEENLFAYPVTVNGVLYKLTLCFGDVVH